MSVKKRIFLLNISMVLVSLMTLLGVITGFIRITTTDFTGSSRWVSDIDENSVVIRQILETAGTNQESWEAVYASVKAYDYELLVIKGSEVVFQSIEIEENAALHLEKMANGRKQGIHTIFGVTFVDWKMQRGEESFYAAAIQMPEAVNFREELEATFSGFSYKIIGISILTIAILVLMGWLFSRKLIANIMRPLEQLTEGARRIAAGDLDQPILYKGDYEFEEVCKAFNSMQEDVKQHEEDRKRYEQARTEMVTSISHDLRTPLTSIKGYIKGILDGVANTAGKQEQYLKIAYDTTGEMDILLQKLFVFSKIETGIMPFDFVRISLPEYINQYGASRELQYLERGLELRIQTEETGYEGMYDIVQMQRVFDNLLENSLRYASREHIIVLIRYQETEEEEILTFRDNGNGVPYDKLPNIFDRFYRCDEARGTEGNGVGLYIVKYIVEAHGGQVTAENKNGLMITMRFEKRME